MTNLPSDRAVGSLQLGAGMFLTGIDPTRADSADALKEMIADAILDETRTLGLTTGGGWFRCVPALRSPAEAARRPPTLGDTLCDGWTVTLTGTLVELTPERLAQLLPGSALTRTGRVATLTLAPDLPAAAYLPRLCWVGDTTDGLVAIELTHALNVSGAALHFVDRGLGTLPFEFRAHQEAADDVPCRVIFLE